MRSYRWSLALVLTASTALPVGAQEVSFHGQVRPRYEYRDPSGGAGRDEFTSMRVRAAVQAMLDENVTVFIQLQDVRLFGEETNTLGDFRADNFDLHQGYLRYRGDELDWLTSTIGRQEVNFGGQRLVGAVGWTQQGRAFDGVRMDAVNGRTTVSLVGFKLAEETAATITNDAELFGAYATVKDVGPGSLDLYGLYDRVAGSAETDEYTYGARYAWSGAVTGRVEVTGQSGSRGGKDLSAYMVGARVGRTFADGKVGLTLWYDYLSGDADPTDGETKVFNTLFATNHKYYGFADLFLNVPVHTGGYGLQDMAIKGAFKLGDQASLNADFHSFRAAEDGTLSDGHFADELDLTVSHRYTRNLTLVSGLSFIFQDALLAQVRGITKNQTWVYVMLNASF